MDTHPPGGMWSLLVGKEISRRAALVQNAKTRYIRNRGNEMAAKVKPVQPKEIKDKKIAREVITQIRKPIPASVHKRHEKKAAYIDGFFK
jgi:hypothetical protein